MKIGNLNIENLKIFEQNHSNKLESKDSKIWEEKNKDIKWKYLKKYKYRNWEDRK